jgi:hypothetical protein
VNAFTNRLQFGRAGESVIASFLRRRGHTVLPAYEKHEQRFKGPQIFQPDRTLVAPDFFVWRGVEAYWVEAKQKSAFSFHRQTERWVTGIDLPHYLDYCALADASPWPVWLMFLHLEGNTAKDSPPGCPCGLFGNDLAILRNKENHRHQNGGRGGMVYWAAATLRLISSIEELNEYVGGVLA